jgi:hypothetical protein
MGETKKGNVTISVEEPENVLGERGAGYARKGSNSESETVFRVDKGL